MNAPRTKAPEPKPKPEPKSTGRPLPLHLFDPANLLKIEFLREHYRFLLFVFALMMLYIGNANMNEKRLKTIAALEDSIKNARRDYISLKKELTHATRESQVASAVEGLELHIITQSPRKIYVKRTP